MKTLIIIDAQNDFCDKKGALSSNYCNEVVEKIADYIRQHSKEYDYIIFTLDTHNERYLNTLEGKHLPVPHCLKNTWGHKLHKSILEARTNISSSIIEYEKSTFGIVWNDALWDIVTDEEIDICGFCTDICVINNALSLKITYPENEINCLSELCAGTSKENHEAALKVMKSSQINII